MSSLAKTSLPSPYKSSPVIDLDRHITPFTSIEDEFRRAAKKLNKMRTRDEIKVPSPKHNRLALLEFEKMQGILDVSSRNVFDDAEALLRITSPEQVIEEELKKISEKMPSKQSPQPVKNAAQAKPNRGMNLESFHNMQIRVNKTIHDTVEEIENNLTLLPEKRKNNRVIDRLSSINLTKPSPKSPFELPKIPSVMKTTSTLASPKDPDSQFKHLETSSVMNITAKEPRKTAATEFFTTKTQQRKPYKTETEKSELRKTCLENFKNVNPRIKDLSNQYLFKLTQHNDTQFGRSSPRNTDQSILQNSTFYVVPNVNQHEISVTGGLYSPVGNSSFLSTSHGQFAKPSSRVLGPLSPKRTKAVSKKSNVPSKNLLTEFDPVESKKNDFLYEGMGLLTLHQMKHCAVRTSADFEPNYFQISVGKLSYRDMDHIKKRTGKNIKHLLFDKMIGEKDLLRLEPRDLKVLL